MYTSDTLCYLHRCLSGIKNKDKFIDCYIKASEQGLVEAQFALGSCYYNGIGVAEDKHKAVEWFTKAASSTGASSGHVDAQLILSKFKKAHEENHLY